MVSFPFCILGSSSKLLFYLTIYDLFDIKSLHDSREVNTMNMAQTTQEKRSIKVKDFLEDFRNGSHDLDLMEKYHLTQAGLEKFYTMLADRRILSAQELQEHEEREKAFLAAEEEFRIDDSSFICPNCLASHEILMDDCPDCGVSFRQLVEDDAAVPVTPVKLEKQDEQPKPERAQKLFSLEEHLEEFCFEAKDPGPPMTSAVEGPEPTPASSHEDHDEFLAGDDFSSFRTGFEDSGDEVVHGMPLDYIDTPETAFLPPEVRCESCSKPMQSGIRDVYERTYTFKALTLSAILVALGFVGTLGLGFFESASFLRLMVFFATGVFVIGGTILAAVGSFLFFARETVYYCPSCKRVYPKG
jgi:hypothetical protein